VSSSTPEQRPAASGGWKAADVVAVLWIDDSLTTIRTGVDAGISDITSWLLCIDSSPSSRDACDAVQKEDSCRNDAVNRTEGGASDKSETSSIKREKLKLSAMGFLFALVATISVAAPLSAEPMVAIPRGAVRHTDGSEPLRGIAHLKIFWGFSICPLNHSKVNRGENFATALKPSCLLHIVRSDHCSYA
jgi:hypothetical protein